MPTPFHSSSTLIQNLQRKEVKPPLNNDTFFKTAKEYFSNTSNYVSSFFYAQKKGKTTQNIQLKKHNSEIKSDSNNKLLQADTITASQLDERVTPHFYTPKIGSPENAGKPLCNPPDDIKYCRQGYNVRLDNMGAEIPFDPNLDNTYSILTQYQGQTDPLFTESVIKHISLPVIGNIVWRCNDIANLTATRVKGYYINTIENYASIQSSKAVVSILTDKVTETQKMCINFYYDELFNQYAEINSPDNNPYRGLFICAGFFVAAVVVGTYFIIVKRRQDPESFAWLPALPNWCQGNYEQIDTINDDSQFSVDNSNTAQLQSSSHHIGGRHKVRVRERLQEQKSPDIRIGKKSNKRYGNQTSRIQFQDNL